MMTSNLHSMNWSEVIAMFVMEKLSLKLSVHLVGSRQSFDIIIIIFIGRINSWLADTNFNGAREKKRRPIADNCMNNFSADTGLSAQQMGCNFQS